jgi:dipeptidyl aminopeptidase/acylaminoacyl peptidase
MGKQLTPELMADMRSPTDPQVSPDGRWIVASVGVASNRDEHPVAALWLAPTDGSTPARQITTGLAEDSKPRWSPDSGTIAFLSDRAKRGKAQLQLLALGGGEARALTDEPGGVSGLCWLPGDAARIAYITPDAKDEEEEERRKRERDDTFVYGEFWPYGRLKILDVASGETRRIEVGQRHIYDLAAAPEGKRLVVLLADTPDIDSGATTSAIGIVDVEGGEVSTAYETGSNVDAPTWARDGSRLYYVAAGGGSPVSSDQLWSLALDGGARPELMTPDLPACVALIARGAGETDLLASVAEGVESALYRFDPVSGELSKLAHFGGELRGLSVSDDGGVVGALGSTPERPFDMYAGNPRAGMRRVSDLHDYLDGVELGPQEVVTWERNGLTLDGILMWPPGKGRADGALPTVVSIHGGPYGRWTNSFGVIGRPFAQYLAAQGYLVFLPNPRGGAGHGQAFAESVHNTVGDEDYLDIMAGVDEIVAQGIADPERIGCGGWSQGGFMTAWIVGHTDRFKCGVMGAGVSDWGMMIATSDIPSYEWHMGGGNPYEGVGPHTFDAQSPVSFLSNVKTPLLVVHGQEDARVPLSQGTFFHRGLLHYGVPTELVTYPREPHGIRERNHVIDLHKRVAGWYQRWIPADG